MTDKKEKETLWRLVKMTEDQKPLVRFNFLIMICAAVAVIIGFLLMLGPGTTPEAFEPDIFSARRVVVGPTIAFLGFVAMAAGIIMQRKKSPKDSGKK